MIYKKEGATFFGGLLGVHLKSVQDDMSPNEEVQIASWLAMNCLKQNWSTSDQGLPIE